MASTDTADAVTDWASKDRRAALLETAISRRPAVGASVLQAIDPKVLADSPVLNQLRTERWQVVVGRQGAGKTALLSALGLMITTSPSADAEASLELRIHDLVTHVQRNDGDEQLSDEVVARIFFSILIEKVVAHVTDVILRRSQTSKFARILEQLTNKNSARRVIERLLQSVAEERAIYFGAELSAEVSENVSRGHDSSASASASALVEALKSHPEAKIKAALDASLWSKQVAQSTQKRRARTVLIPYHETRKLLINLFKSLKLQRVTLIIDDWSDLDNYGGVDLQPHLTHIFRSAFDARLFTIKLSATREHWHPISTVGRRSIGIDDIAIVDLDTIYLAMPLQKRVEFLRNILFRYLNASDGLLDELATAGEHRLFGVDYRSAGEEFTRAIFASRVAFMRLVYGSAGNPGDFLEIFFKIAQERNYSLRPKWSEADVLNAIRKHFLHRKETDLHSDARVRELADGVASEVRKNESLFVVFRDVEKDTEFGRSIDRLRHARLLHDVPNEWIPDDVPRSHRLFFADFGFAVGTGGEGLRGLKGALRKVGRRPLRGRSVTARDLAKYVVSVENVTPPAPSPSASAAPAA